MGVLAALAGQWKFGLYGLLAAGLLIGGWMANGWRMKAAKADHLQAALSASIKREVEANAARVALGLQLSEAEATIITGTKVVREKVRVFVPASADCNIPDGFRSLLERARRGEMPPAADDAPVAPSGP